MDRQTGSNQSYEDEFNNLYELYKNKSESELLEMLNSGDEYSECAKEVAQYILDNDRSEYKEKMAKIQLKEQQTQEKIEARKTNPLYDDIHQIAKDVQFFRTVLTVYIVISIVAFLYVLSHIRL